MSRRRQFHPPRPRPRSRGRALVYLRTALDPAPVVTSAGEFRGLLGCGDAMAAGQRRRDRRRRLAAGAQLHGHVGRLLGGDEFGRRPATQSAVHPRGDRRASQRGQGQNAVRPAARRARAACTRRPRGCARWRPASSASSCCRSTAASRSTRGDARRPADDARQAPMSPIPTGSSRCCRPAAPRARQRWCR